MNLHPGCYKYYFGGMDKLCLLFPAKILLFVCGMLLMNLRLIGSDVSGASNAVTQSPDSGKTVAIQEKNTQRARKLIETLYLESSVGFENLSYEKNGSLKAGTQAGYYGKAGTDQAYSPLVLYRRVWIYDAAIALSLAIQNKDSTVNKRALWLLKNGQYTRHPENPEKNIFAGWPFSANQKDYGDHWTDCRFITGANACGLQAIAEYIASDYYLKLGSKLKAAYSKLYADALSGILYHIELDGPNQGLITSGWSLNILEEISTINYSYNKILDMLGYGPREVDGYPNAIRRVKAKNVLTEHNNNVLSLLNYTLDHYDRLWGPKGPYTYSELNEIRVKLRESIYSKLYDNDKRRFISGRSPSGKPSPYTSVDNASWLSFSLKLDELSDEQVKALSDSLFFTVNNFTKEFNILGKTYFGAYHFEDGFEDTYIEKSEAHSDSLHVESICGLICGLLEFANAFPDDPNVSLFRSTASHLWQDLQRFIDDFGFVYASNSLKDVAEPIEASVSAIWYLKTLEYFKEDPQAGKAGTNIEY